MRVLVAGAAGAIGRHLVPMLIADGHPVIGTTRDSARAEWLRSVGAEPVVVDVYDADAVRRAMKASRPEAVIHQLTDLAKGFDPEQLRANDRLRELGTRHLVDAMVQTGARRLIAQSGAWLYAPGDGPHTEEHPLRDPSLAPDDPALPAILELERLTLATPGIEGIVLRYGLLHGPGTAHTRPEDVRGGPPVHVAAAARAAVLALDGVPPGIYNVVDNDRSVSNRRAREVLGWDPDMR